MPVIRIEKTANYTVISNYPLRDSRLSLKACALLCKMLCNTDTWDYSITGMAAMCKDGKSAVSSAMKELEQYGYLVRKQHRNEKGQIVDTEYIIYESPELNVEYMQKQAELADSAEPEFFSASEEPPAENPFPEDAEPENDAQINTIPTSTETINTDAISAFIRRTGRQGAILPWAAFLAKPLTVFFLTAGTPEKCSSALTATPQEVKPAPDWSRTFPARSPSFALSRQGKTGTMFSVSKGTFRAANS